MPSPNVLNLEELLAPISEESPAGVDLRSDPEQQQNYYAARDARTAAAREERQAAASGNPADFGSIPAEWATLVQTAPALIASQSKHLEIAAWLTEALVRIHGFAGLRDGLRLLHGLIEKYWDGLYPMPDETGMEARVFPLVGLNGADTDGTLVTAIRRIPITKDGGFAQWQYTRAQNLEGAPADQRQKQIDEGAVSLEMFKSAALTSGWEYYETLREDVSTCLEVFEAMTRTLDERCGHDSPPSTRIKSMLEDILGTITEVAPPKPSVESGDGEAGGDGQGGGGKRPGPVNSREQAFATLLEVASFFERTEPHSPVSFALKQAVRWGQMSLPTLWSELIPNADQRKAVFRLIGIQEEEG